MTMLNQDASKRLVAKLSDEPAPERSQATLRGFGFTVTAHGGVRRWYVGADGVTRWASNDLPVDQAASCT